MKIGLIRHFKVKHAFPKKFLLNVDELTDWFDGYDQAELDIKSVDMLGIEWQNCLSSSLPRAIKTAQSVYNGDIVKLDALRELNPLSTLPNNIRLPFLIWAILIRIKVSGSHVKIKQFKSEINKFSDQLLRDNSQNTLIVSHGFVMMFLQKEMKKRGFKGRGFRTPENGKLYVFDLP